ncbi:hypothetical protein ACW9UR_20025 [Halovulum sp. GXIMD14794]
MKRIVLATIAAAALAAPLSAQTTLNAELSKYVDNPGALTTAQIATIKGLTESDLSSSELDARINAIID